MIVQADDSSRRGLAQLMSRAQLHPRAHPALRRTCGGRCIAARRQDVASYSKRNMKYCVEKPQVAPRPSGWL
eukprot:3765929-Prymnesium_polylepis.1